MKKLAIITLAATALVPASALAQHSTVSPPVKWEDVPDARLRVHGAQPRMHVQAAPAPHAAPHAPVRVEVRRHGAPAANAPAHVEVRRREGAAAHAPAGARTRQVERIIVRRGERTASRGHHGINRYPHYRRIDRGFALPRNWWGPRFHIRNWNMYGFSQPMHGNRWVRYYDDALLIDHQGRVHDGRYGMDWDRYGDAWGHDESGIPAYPGDEDYAWEDEERYAGGYERGYRHRQSYGHGGGYGQQPVYAHPPIQSHPYPAYGYGYGYGAIITETTVTTSPTVVSETYYVDKVVTKRAHKQRRAKRAAPCKCVKAAPAHPYGERG